MTDFPDKWAIARLLTAVSSMNGTDRVNIKTGLKVSVTKSHFVYAHQNDRFIAIIFIADRNEAT